MAITLRDIIYYKIDLLKAVRYLNSDTSVRVLARFDDPDILVALV
jgi:hypothetical protein